MIKTYLTSKGLFSLLGLNLLAYGLGTLFFIASLLFTTLALFVCRREDNPMAKGAHQKSGVVFSPVSGKVEKIWDDDFHSELNQEMIGVQIHSSFMAEWGVRMPIDCEVVALKKLSAQTKSTSNTTFMRLIDKSGLDFALAFFKRAWGKEPIFWAKPGDRAVAGADIGVRSLGGALKLWLPKQLKVLVKEGDLVKAAETPIAGPTVPKVR